MLRLILAAQCELRRQSRPSPGVAVRLPFAVGGWLVVFAAFRQFVG